MLNRIKPFGYSPDHIAKKNKEIQDKYKEQDKKKAVAKKMKTFHGRPIEELKKEAGLGKHKERYER